MDHREQRVALSLFDEQLLADVLADHLLHVQGHGRQIAGQQLLQVPDPGDDRLQDRPERRDADGGHQFHLGVGDTHGRRGDPELRQLVLLLPLPRERRQGRQQHRVLETRHQLPGRFQHDQHRHAGQCDPDLGHLRWHQPPELVQCPARRNDPAPGDAAQGVAQAGRRVFQPKR